MTTKRDELREVKTAVMQAIWDVYVANSVEKLPADLDDARTALRVLVSSFADAALTALQPALDAAREEGRAGGRTAEREFVVAWLWQNQTLAQYHWGPPIINAIERGDHTKGEK